LCVCVCVCVCVRACVRVVFSYDDRNASNYRIVVGEFDRYQQEDDELHFGVRQLLIHEKYFGQQTLWDSDIALVEIDGRCPLTACTKPICLPDSLADDSVVLCYATGWGRDIGMFQNDYYIQGMFYSYLQ